MKDQRPFRLQSSVTVTTVALGALLALFVTSEVRQSGTDGAVTVARAASRSKEPKAPALDHPPVNPPASAAGDVWPDAEIISALQECVRLLAPTGAHVELSKPIRNGQCGTPAPLVLRRAAGVELNPAAVVNCPVAAKVNQWIKETVQPTAQEMLGTTVTRIVTASSYMCRQRVGTSNERLSEHSFANALDISAFVTADGRSIDVLSHWGPTVRDREAQAATEGVLGGDAQAQRDVERVDRGGAEERVFLRRMHEGACGLFGTVLGPEANEAHRNHLHLDLAARKRSAFCE